MYKIRSWKSAMGDKKFYMVFGLIGFGLTGSIAIFATIYSQVRAADSAATAYMAALDRKFDQMKDDPTSQTDISQYPKLESRPFAGFSTQYKQAERKRAYAQEVVPYAAELLTYSKRNGSGYVLLSDYNSRYAYDIDVNKDIYLDGVSKAEKASPNDGSVFRIAYEDFKAFMDGFTAINTRLLAQLNERRYDVGDLSQAEILHAKERLEALIKTANECVDSVRSIDDDKKADFAQEECITKVSNDFRATRGALNFAVYVRIMTTDHDVANKVIDRVKPGSVEAASAETLAGARLYGYVLPRMIFSSETLPVMADGPAYSAYATAIEAQFKGMKRDISSFGLSDKERKKISEQLDESIAYMSLYSTADENSGYLGQYLGTIKQIVNSMNSLSSKILDTDDTGTFNESYDAVIKPLIAEVRSPGYIKYEGDGFFTKLEELRKTLEEQDALELKSKELNDRLDKALETGDTAGIDLSERASFKDRLDELRDKSRSQLDELTKASQKIADKMDKEADFDKAVHTQFDALPKSAL